MLPLGWTIGSIRRSTAARISMATAAMMNTVRQPRVAATIPLTTRAISTPIIRPLITVPTARPR